MAKAKQKVTKKKTIKHKEQKRCPNCGKYMK